MKREKIEEVVRQIVVEQLQVHPSQVTETVSFVDDLAADSIDCSELVMAFEEYFDIEIPTETEDGMRTFGNVVDWLEAALIRVE